MGDYNLGPIRLIMWNVRVARNYKLGPINQFWVIFPKKLLKKLAIYCRNINEKCNQCGLNEKLNNLSPYIDISMIYSWFFSKILSLRYITTQYRFHVSRYTTYCQYLLKILSLGWIGFRFTFMHKGVLVIMQHFVEVSEQGLWIGLTD